MTKLELFKGYARQMDGFGFYLGENEAYDLMDEWAKQQAIAFAE